MTVRPSGTTTAAPRRFEELEAYRGIAALCVIIFHTYQYSRQGSGLAAHVYEGTPLHLLFIGLHMSSVFFTLSGFLLFLPFVRAALTQSPQPSTRSFLVRRLIRILPLYYLLLLLVWAWRFDGYPGQLTDLALHLSFTQTFHPTYIFWTIGPAWSLAVEIHFYLFLTGFAPLLYWLCGRLPRGEQRQALIGGLIALLVVASVVLKWWGFTAQPGGPSVGLIYSLPGKLDAFALGMLLALAVAVRGDRPVLGQWGARLTLAAGLALVAGAALLKTLHPLLELYHPTLVGAGTALLVAATVLGPRGSRWERTMQLPPLRFVGTISYGLFLFHEPIMIELGRAGLLISPAPEAFPVNVPVLIGLSMLAATLSYHLLERPCNELRYLFDRHGRLIERYSGVQQLPEARPEPVAGVEHDMAARRPAGQPEPSAHPRPSPPRPLPPQGVRGQQARESPRSGVVGVRPEAGAARVRSG